MPSKHGIDSSSPEESSTSAQHRNEKDDFVKDEFVEEANLVQLISTLADAPEAEELSQEHRDYLLKRHGTFDLDPIPDMQDADPYNWPAWKVLLSFPRLEHEG